MDDLYIMANIANAGTESRRVFHSAEIEELIAEIEYKAARERELREARAEGERAVYIAQERRRARYTAKKAKRDYNYAVAVIAVLFTLAMLFIPALFAMI